MRQERLIRPVALAFVLFSVAVASTATTVPILVSPGRGDRVSVIENRCPTFSWGAVEQPKSFEIVVYRASEHGARAEPVLRRRLPGSADTWTPSLEACLERGSRYAWAVRSLGPDSASAWSPLSLFQIAVEPGGRGLEEALRLVRSYFESTGWTPASNEIAVDPDLEPVREGGPGMQSAPAPPTLAASTLMTVDGGVVAASFAGDGSGLTGIDAVTELSEGSGIDLTPSPLSSTGTIAIDTSVVPRLGESNTFTLGQTVQSGSAVKQGLVVQGVSAQTANLQEWRDYSGTVVASVSPIGTLSGNGSGLTGINAVTALSEGSGIDLTPNPLSSTGTIAIDTSVVPRLGEANTFTHGQTIQSGSAATQGLVVQGASAQTANLQEWRDYSSAVVASVSPTGALTGIGSGLTGIGRFLEASPEDGCHLVTDANIKTPGLYCPASGGGEVLCASNADSSPFVCSDLSEPACQAWCLDTSSQPSATAILARPVIPASGVVTTYVDRTLACHFRGTTFVRLEQTLVCASGGCTVGLTKKLGEDAASFAAMTAPSTIWQILPGASIDGVASLSESGNYTIRLRATMDASAPYATATCFFVNKIDDDSLGSDDNNAIRVIFRTPGSLGTWSGV